jgi:tetratricopeptide (TPR) repeat protein
MRQRRLFCLFWLATVLVGGEARSAAAPPVPTTRLRVAVLTFADGTGDPQHAHWRYAIRGMLAHQLYAVKAVRVLPGTAVAYARRQRKVSPGARLDAALARKLGELIEAQRVVWGSYRREGQAWRVTARVLQVASGKVSAELSVTAADWFQVCDQLTAQILAALPVTPSEEERARMAQHGTTSPAAWEWRFRAYALDAERKPWSAFEEAARQAVTADPQYAEAHLFLAQALFMQGKLAPAREAVLQALKLKPDDASAHLLLGVSSLLEDKLADGERELHEAHRLDPDDTEPLQRLGELYAVQEKWDEATRFLERARRLDPTDASTHAQLGRAYAGQRDRARAMAALHEAERLDPDDVGAHQIAALAYDTLNETERALAHCEAFVRLARRQGFSPERIDPFTRRAEELKATLTPAFVRVPMPKRYSERALQEALKRKLTPSERALVVNPLASRPEMKRWAQQVTRGAGNDLTKARKLFDTLARSYYRAGGTRTAEEVFAAWNDPNASFNCQEYARLFVALARDVGVRAFFAEVKKDFRGKEVYHACAAVFAEGKVVLVDLAYSWFGPPHREFAPHDDLQAIADHLSQPKASPQKLARARLAARLCPDLAWVQVSLARVLMTAGEWPEARTALEAAARLGPGRWDVYYLRGVFANRRDRDPAAAVGFLRKALELNPDDSLSHLELAEVLRAQGKAREAREEYRACVRCDPAPDAADVARRAIAAINEEIGAE